MAGCYRGTQCQYLHEVEKDSVTVAAGNEKIKLFENQVEFKTNIEILENNINEFQYNNEQLIEANQDAKENKIRNEGFTMKMVGKVKRLENAKKEIQENIETKKGPKYTNIKHQQSRKVQTDEKHETRESEVGDIAAVGKKAITFTFSRVELDSDAFDILETHAVDSEMNMEEFVSEMPKIIEGYIQRDLKNKSTQ